VHAGRRAAAHAGGGKRRSTARRPSSNRAAVAISSARSRCPLSLPHSLSLFISLNLPSPFADPVEQRADLAAPGIGARGSTRSGLGARPPVADRGQRRGGPS
jgi:hypothetical protein